MKKSILFSLMVIGAVAAMITAATSAVFTDTVTTSQNQFSTKIVDLALGTTATNCDETVAPFGGPCTQTSSNVFIGTTRGAADFRPGDVLHYDFSVVNSGSADYTYTAAIEKDTSGLWTCNSNAVVVTLSKLSGSVASGASADTVTATVTFNSNVGDNACQGFTNGGFDVKFVATQS